MSSAEIDRYIETFSPDVQEKLKEIRAIIKEAAPTATEKFSYQMPTFYLEGNLVHFAAYARHIGFYPTPSGIENFQGELDRYKNAKGSVQFPLDEPLPVALIKKIVEFRVEENSAMAAAKASTKAEAKAGVKAPKSR
jgi:uncharacterized protein YdhG (YjbR/CyaY superfamily)